MDKVSLLKDEIYDMALEKQALSLQPLIQGAKTVAKDVASTGIGKKVMNSSLGTKMAVGAAGGMGAGLLRAPKEGEDRLSNAITGGFAGASAGMMAHGITNGIKPMLNGASKATAAVKPAASGAIITPPPAQRLALPAPPPAPTMNGNMIENVPFSVASNIIDDLYMEKVADAGSFGNTMKRFYNNTLGANTLKTTVMGAGIGGMMGTMGYKEDKDDGSFGRSRLGGMATGMLAGAGAGLATGLAFKPIKGVPKAPKPQAPNPVPDKVAEYMDVIYGEAMEKKAANPITTIARGATDAYEDFKKLDEVTRVAIGSSIGGTIGVLTGLQQQKGKNDKKFLAKAKDVGKAGFEGALMGAAVTGMIGYKPGDIKRDIQEIFKQGR